MDVYLVPVGPDRYQLYCESVFEGAPVMPAEGSGLWKRLSARFTTMLAAIEREHDRIERSRAAARLRRRKGWPARLRMRTVRWLAEKVAEQRLLWHLRTEREACALYPVGLGDDRAMSVIRSNLSSDFGRHRWWLAINTLAGIGSLALMPLPGPNIIGFYFAFRIVGHFLSVRGARQGLDVVTWRLRESPPLAELGSSLRLPPADRRHVVVQVSRQLGLRRLPRFFDRMTPNSA
jgi:hypothetical protein